MSMRRPTPVRLAVLLAVLAGPGCSSPAARPPPAAAAAPPTYPVPPDVERLLEDDADFARFARVLRGDLERQLGRRDLARDARRADLFDLAVLDALDGDWERADRRVREVMALEEQPAARLMAGLTIRVWAAARRAGGDPPAAFRRALEEAVGAMPREVVQGELAMLEAMGRVFSLEACKALVKEHIGPDASDGAIAREQASALVFQRYAVLHLVPVGAVIVDVLAAPAPSGQ
jgi:hypothetical protein